MNLRPITLSLSGAYRGGGNAAGLVIGRRQHGPPLGSRFGVKHVGLRTECLSMLMRCAWQHRENRNPGWQNSLTILRQMENKLHDNREKEKSTHDLGNRRDDVDTVVGARCIRLASLRKI